MAQTTGTGQGFCEAILLHLDSIAGQNYPGKKVTIPGFTQMLLDQPNSPTAIQDGFMGGHKRGVRVKYSTRGTVSQVSTTDTCSVVDWSFTNSSIKIAFILFQIKFSADKPPST